MRIYIALRYNPECEGGEFKIFGVSRSLDGAKDLAQKGYEEQIHSQTQLYWGDWSDSEPEETEAIAAGQDLAYYEIVKYELVP